MKLKTKTSAKNHCSHRRQGNTQNICDGYSGLFLAARRDLIVHVKSFYAITQKTPDNSVPARFWSIEIIR